MPSGGIAFSPASSEPQWQVAMAALRARTVGRMSKGSEYRMFAGRGAQSNGTHLA